MQKISIWKQCDNLRTVDLKKKLFTCPHPSTLFLSFPSPQIKKNKIKKILFSSFIFFLANRMSDFSNEFTELEKTPRLLLS